MFQNVVTIVVVGGGGGGVPGCAAGPGGARLRGPGVPGQKLLRGLAGPVRPVPIRTSRHPSADYSSQVGLAPVDTLVQTTVHR